MAETDPGGYPVSTAELTTSETSEPPAGVSHLLAAEDALSPGWSSIRVTLCGEDLRAGDTGTTAVAHCPSCECGPRFCRACVREACQWSA